MDYVDKSTKGVATSYSFIAAGLGGIYSSFCIMQLVESYDTLLGTILTAGSMFLLSIYLLCFLKNTLTLKRDRPPPPVQGNCCKRFFYSMGRACVYCWQHKAFLLIFYATIAFHLVKSMGTHYAQLWAAKYIYVHDRKAKAAHAKYLGIANYFNLGFAFISGCLFDRFGPRFFLVGALVAGSGALVGLYFVGPLNSALAFAIQISIEVLASQGTHFAAMTLATLTPSYNKGTIYSLHGVASTLVNSGFDYLNGWVIDSPYNRAPSFVTGITGLASAVLFLLVALLAPKIYEKKEEPAVSPQNYSQLSEEIHYK